MITNHHYKKQKKYLLFKYDIARRLLKRFEKEKTYKGGK